MCYLDEGVLQQKGVESQGETGEGDGHALFAGVGAMLAAGQAVVRGQTLLG